MNLKKNIFLFFFLLYSSGLFFSEAFSANEFLSDYKKNSNVKLVSPYRTISKRVKKIPIGLWVTLNEGWHSYWQYPGESGKALKVKWILPKDSVVSPLQWPLPERIHFGSVVNFGYKKNFLLMSELSLPKEQIYRKVNIQAQVEWLICKEVCIPLTQSVSLEIYRSGLKSSDLKAGLPGRKGREATKKSYHIGIPLEVALEQNAKKHQERDIETHWLSEFNKWSARIPKISNEEIKLQSAGEHWLVNISTEKKMQILDIIPLSKGLFSLQPPVVLSKNTYQHSLFINPSSGEKIVHTVSEAGNALRTLAVFKDQDAKVGIIYNFTYWKKSIVWFLLLAFLGGIILNFMPCVLPIVFLKFSNTVEQSQQKTSVMILGNIFYSLGVIFSFILLAFVLLLFKKGGESIGWGFQMQSPYFLLSIILFFVLISFGFMGWFSISLPAIPFFHRGQNSFKHFLTGILSTTAASPCTAPFMGAAIGYAFSGSIFQIVMVFLFLGLGLSFPYILLSVFPKWIQYMPLPGSWSHKLKHLMAFPMLVTSAWLIHLLNRQVPEHLFPLLFSLLLLTFGFWLLHNVKQGWLLKWFSRLIIIIALIYPFTHLYQRINTEVSYIPWEAFSLEKMEEIHSGGQALFINFTADWCLTCKLNERITFRNKKVIHFFKERQIRALKGDWTNKNPEITTVLERYQRAGIPFYLYFPAEGKEASAVVLPELLTPGVFFRYVY